MRLFLLPLSLLVLVTVAQAATPNFAEFDRRAKRGDRLTVVFFGASLTWGANASDQINTSYRARVAERLEAKYPKAHFKFFDAAIGGTGSQLGVFRLDRDVLSRKPDLVFLDFSANDDIYSDNPESLASYESLVRRIIRDANAPVVQVIFPFGWNVTQANLSGMKRRTAHLAIASAYNTVVGDAIALGIEKVKAGTLTIQQIWPFDQVHPGDTGYAMFAEAAWTAFEDGVKRKVICRLPEKMLYAETYMTLARARISTLGPLPDGWRATNPGLTAAWHDALMTRWLDDVVHASNRKTVVGADGKKSSVPNVVAPLKVKFRGQMVLLFGEETIKSGRYRVRIDGKVVTYVPYGSKEPIDYYDASSKRMGGTRQQVQTIATGLAPDVDHTFELEVLLSADEEQELRLESICVAGKDAKVWKE
jgi:lysophospholipase L1-like esterase